ncbi:MAG: T9SS type A sorting domain-containing protein, partial [Bacteroidia bacterium]|nr:T9SS type A sorting domain-containing protein [Bacteroidia bacterium]
ERYRRVAYKKSQHTDNAILVYPNPSQGQFFIKNIAKKSHLNIFDYQGVKVHSESIQKNNIFQCNVNLTSGIYILELVNSDGTFKKIISITH